MNNSIYQSADQNWRLSVAPMLDVTDRHCRFFHRLLAPKALVYSEMVTTGALIHGDIKRHLLFNPEEYPIALQLGGSDPKDLASCAKLAQQWGYDEINLNCGCPSDRVQKGAFGACLMAEPKLVAECFEAMQNAVDIPVTIKHRLGLDYEQDYYFVYDFVSRLYEAGCRVFIAHARNAVLKGLSPKENRNIPPLRYDYVTRLKTDFADCTFILNGGLNTLESMQAQLNLHDGIMVGRAAWHEPYLLSDISQYLWPSITHLKMHEIINKMYFYAKTEIMHGVPLRVIVKPMLGLFNGKKGAKQWRRLLSDHHELKKQDPSLILQAYEYIQKNKIIEK